MNGTPIDFATPQLTSKLRKQLTHLTHLIAPNTVDPQLTHISTFIGKLFSKLPFAAVMRKDKLLFKTASYLLVMPLTSIEMEFAKATSLRWIRTVTFAMITNKDRKNVGYLIIKNLERKNYAVNAVEADIYHRILVFNIGLSYSNTEITKDLLKC